MRQLPHAEGRGVARHRSARTSTTPFSRTEAEGFEESTIKNVVLDQIRFPRKEASCRPTSSRARTRTTSPPTSPSAPASTDKVACPGSRVAGGGGEGLYASLGCQGCHSIDGSASSGPTFKGLFNSMVPLANGQKVKADEQYLLESILDPDKQIVKGYQPGVMSAVDPEGLGPAGPGPSSSSTTSRRFVESPAPAPPVP